MPSPGNRGYFKVHPFETLTDLMHMLQNELCMNIIRCLVEEPADVTVLRRRLNLEQSATSHALAMLLGSGCVEVERVKKNRVYRIAARIQVQVQGDLVTLRLTCRNGHRLTLETTLLTSKELSVSVNHNPRLVPA